MGTVMGTLLVLAAVAVLAWPFIRRGPGAAMPNVEADRLRAERLRIYRQISDLEESLVEGDVSQADYESQLQEFRLAAAHVMRDEARAGVSREDEERLEREIQAARSGRRKAPEGGDRV